MWGFRAQVRRGGWFLASSGRIWRLCSRTTVNRRTAMTTIAASPEEHLENGYAAATPAGDNLLLDYVRGEAAGFGDLIGTLGGPVEREPGYGGPPCHSGLPTPFANAALLSRPIADGQVEGMVGTLR